MIEWLVIGLPAAASASGLGWWATARWRASRARERWREAAEAVGLIVVEDDAPTALGNREGRPIETSFDPRGPRTSVTAAFEAPLSLGIVDVALSKKQKDALRESPGVAELSQRLTRMGWRLDVTSTCVRLDRDDAFEDRTELDIVLDLAVQLAQRVERASSRVPTDEREGSVRQGWSRAATILGADPALASTLDLRGAVDDVSATVRARREERGWQTRIWLGIAAERDAELWMVTSSWRGPDPANVSQLVHAVEIRGVRCRSAIAEHGETLVDPAVAAVLDALPAPFELRWDRGGIELSVDRLLSDGMIEAARRMMELSETLKRGLDADASPYRGRPRSS